MIIILLAIYLVDWQAYLAVITMITIVEMVLFLFDWVSSQMGSMVTEYVEMVESEEDKQED